VEGILQQKPLERQENAEFGVVFRSRSQSGFDFIKRSARYMELKSILYNIPDKEINYFHHHFRDTDCMILCALAADDVDLEYKVPVLREKILILKRFRADTIAKIEAIHKGDNAVSNQHIDNAITRCDNYFNSSSDFFGGLDCVEFLHQIWLDEQTAAQ
jgi:hypothetical protein